MINLKSKARDVFDQPFQGMENITRALKDVAKALECEPNGNVALTITPRPNQLLVSVVMKDYSLETDGAEVRRDFLLTQEERYMAVERNSFAIERDWANPGKTFLSEYQLGGQYMAEEEIIKSVTRCAASYMAPQAREALGNNPQFQALDSSVTEILYKKFPPVSGGIAALVTAFDRMGAVLREAPRAMLRPAIGS